MRRLWKSLYGGQRGDVDWGAKAKKKLLALGLDHICDHGEASLFAWYSSSPPGAAATTTVALRGAAVGDLLLASHTGMGASTALEISARCVKAGEALVIMRHVAGGGSAVIDPEKGQLRVAALQYL